MLHDDATGAQTRRAPDRAVRPTMTPDSTITPSPIVAVGWINASGAMTALV
ncbi:MAG: hypothetical protein ACFHWZ_06630 [Phycisphaerales bacterium]